MKEQGVQVKKTHSLFREKVIKEIQFAGDEQEEK